MIDATTHEALRVSIDGTAGPYIMVPVSQLNELTDLLTSHRISYDVDENAISLNGTPEVTIVNLRRRVDATAVQRVLDGVR